MTINEKENEIIRLKELLNNCDSKRKSKKLKNKIVQLEKFQNIEIEEYLSKNNDGYKTLKNENLALISGNYKGLKYKEGSNYFTSNTLEFNGSLKKNGYIYLNSSNVGLEFADVFRRIGVILGFKIFPKSYSGVINSFGKVELKIKKYNYSIFGSYVPKEYSITISELGIISMKTTKKEFEFFGVRYVDKVIIDMFKTETNNFTEFKNNIAKMKIIIAEKKKELKKVGNN